MCLNTVSKTLFTNYKKENGNYVGWKVFRRDVHYHIYPQFQSIKRFKINEWINEKDYRNDSNKEYINSNKPSRYPSPYPTGFHFYLSKADAMRSNYRSNYFFEEIRKIYFRKQVACGWQGGKRVIVAKELYIPSLKKVNNNVSQ